MTKFVAIASGKGGVGKTTSTLNIGQALSNLGKTVVLVDTNIVTPNLGLHLDLINPEGTLNKFLRKESSLKDVMHQHQGGFSVIPASPSYHESQNKDINLTRIFSRLDNTADFVLLDLPSGLGQDVSHCLSQSDEVLIVVNPTLSSVMDALKTMQLAKENDTMVAGIILNMSNKGRHEMKPSEVEEILGHPLIANVRTCKKVRKAQHRREPLNSLYPRAKSAKEFHKVAEHLSLQHKIK